MEFVEMETKEDIMATAEIERTVAPEVMDHPEEYLSQIEHTVRMDSEAGAEYYLVYSGGAAGFFALHNEGLTVKVDKVAVLPAKRRKGVLKRILAFIRRPNPFVNQRPRQNLPPFGGTGLHPAGGLLRNEV